MNGSKYLSDSAWKDVAARNNVKDNGLLKKLADFRHVGESRHDEALKLLGETLKLAGLLNKDRKTAAPAVKYLDELAAAAAAAVREVTRAKAEADKAAKAQAEKGAQADAARKGEEEGDEGESAELLTTKLKPLLRLVAKGETMHTLVAKSGKQVAVLLSRKPIPPARRKLLADQLGGGSTKYYPGHCTLEAGVTTFALKAEVAGMAKLLKAALLEQTGLRLNKVKCRGDDGDDHDDDEERAVEASADGDAAKAAAAEEKLSLARLKQARVEWNGARAHALRELARLKQILQDDYRDAGSAQAQLAKALQRVDATIDAMGEALEEHLDQVVNAHAAQRAGRVADARAAVQRLIKLVGSDDILQHIDGNELAPDMLIAEPLRARLTAIAHALP